MSAGAVLPEQRQYVSREDFAAQRGADPQEATQVEAFAQGHHLTVVETSLAKRTVRLAGSLADLTEAFRPKLKRAKVGNRVVRMRTGALSVPAELADIVVAVLGFDNRSTAQPHFRQRKQPAGARAARPAGKGKKAAGTKTRGVKPSAHNAADGSFTPPEVARLYNFPGGLDGSGQCIAIIELNNFDQQGNPTGTGFTPADLQAYFTSLGLPLPNVTAVGVPSSDGTGANVPGPDKKADGEVMLDIEVAGAVAPNASIVVYFALNTDDGFLAALNAAPPRRNAQALGRIH